MPMSEFPTVRVAVVMPVVLRKLSLWEMTVRACASIKLIEHATFPDRRVSLSFFLMVNHLGQEVVEELSSRFTRAADASLMRLYGSDKRLMTRTQMANEIKNACQEIYWLRVDDSEDRCVARSWNRGISHAIEQRADLVCVMANDAELDNDTLTKLVHFSTTPPPTVGQVGPTNSSVFLWSGIARNQTTPQPGFVAEGADFTCFMLRPEVIAKVGWFDENFRPAYFEDNDFYARIILAGGCCKVIHDATFVHHGSQTMKQDEEQRHHINHWFGLNRKYFAEKWGVSQPAPDDEAILNSYFKTPYNSGKALSYWKEENS